MKELKNTSIEETWKGKEVGPEPTRLELKEAGRGLYTAAARGIDHIRKKERKTMGQLGGQQPEQKKQKQPQKKQKQPHTCPNSNVDYYVKSVLKQHVRSLVPPRLDRFHQIRITANRPRH